MFFKLLFKARPISVFSGILLHYVESLPQTVPMNYYSPAEFPFSCRHRPAGRSTTWAGAVSTSWQHRWVGCGIREGGLTGILDPEAGEGFWEKPGVVSTFPVTLPQREKSLLLMGRPGCANKGKYFKCQFIWQVLVNVPLWEDKKEQKCNNSFPGWSKKVILKNSIQKNPDVFW